MYNLIPNDEQRLPLQTTIRPFRPDVYLYAILMPGSALFQTLRGTGPSLCDINCVQPCIKYVIISHQLSFPKLSATESRPWVPNSTFQLRRTAVPSVQFVSNLFVPQIARDGRWNHAELVWSNKNIFAEWLQSSGTTYYHNSNISLPQSARLSSHNPFRSLNTDNQAGISGKIRRKSVPFLCVFAMGLADKNPDYYVIFQCSLRSEVANKMHCANNRFTNAAMDMWQRKCFAFGVLMCTLFYVYVSTELHRLMRHIYYHLCHLGCLRRGSSEENEMHHKEFKSI